MTNKTVAVVSHVDEAGSHLDLDGLGGDAAFAGLPQRDVPGALGG